MMKKKKKSAIVTITTTKFATVTTEIVAITEFIIVAKVVLQDKDQLTVATIITATFIAKHAVVECSGWLAVN